MNRRIDPQERVNVAITHAEWIAISERIAKPWPPEAVRVDLDIREQLPIHDSALLGRTACMERWGWTEKRVRRAFEGGGPSVRR